MQQRKNIPQSNIWSVWLGAFLVMAGALCLAYTLGAAVPGWLVSWPMALITAGLLLAVYQRFKAGLWLIPIFWGAYLMADMQAPYLHLGRYLGPFSIILAGFIILIIRRKHQFTHHGRFRFEKNSFTHVTGLGALTKRDIATDDFKGADVTSVLGSAVIDLRNADVQGTALIDVTAFLGSAKIYIPGSWAIRNDITTVFGDIKHTSANKNPVWQEDKVIKLDGTAVFGAIEIISC